MNTNPNQTAKNQQEPFTPWHAEPWVWFIISLLTVTFCWGGVRLYTALSYKDSVVVDDYYKRGKSVNQDMTRTRAARNQNIEANITIDDLIGEVRVQVTGNPEQWPDKLILRFLSPVFADRDITLSIHRAVTGDYVGQLQELVSGRYYLQLETEDKTVPEKSYKTGWRLTMETLVTPGQPIRLKQS